MPLGNGSFYVQLIKKPKEPLEIKTVYIFFEKPLLEFVGRESESQSSLVMTNIHHTDNSFSWEDIQRHKAALLVVVPKASRREMLALCPEMTMSVIMCAR